MRDTKEEKKNSDFVVAHLKLAYMNDKNLKIKSVLTPDNKV